MRKDTTIRIDDEIKQKLKILAIKQKITLKELVDRITNNYIDKKFKSEN